jgi:hypothetical protein
MDIQQKLSKQQSKLATLEALLEKEIWSDSEKERYGNKHLAEIEKDMVDVSIELLLVEQLFEKDYTAWTQTEKNKYGNEYETAVAQLRKNRDQLTNEKELLLHLKVKETPSTSQGIGFVNTRDKLTVKENPF